MGGQLRRTAVYATNKRSHSVTFTSTESAVSVAQNECTYLLNRCMVNSSLVVLSVHSSTRGTT